MLFLLSIHRGQGLTETALFPKQWNRWTMTTHQSPQDVLGIWWGWPIWSKAKHEIKRSQHEHESSRYNAVCSSTVRTSLDANALGWNIEVIQWLHTNSAAQPTVNHFFREPPRETAGYGLGMAHTQHSLRIVHLCQIPGILESILGPPEISSLRPQPPNLKNIMRWGPTFSRYDFWGKSVSWASSTAY